MRLYDPIRTTPATTTTLPCRTTTCFASSSSPVLVPTTETTKQKESVPAESTNDSLLGGCNSQPPQARLVLPEPRRRSRHPPQSSCSRSKPTSTTTTTTTSRVAATATKPPRHPSPRRVSPTHRAVVVSGHAPHGRRRIHAGPPPPPPPVVVGGKDHGTRTSTIPAHTVPPQPPKQEPPQQPLSGAVPKPIVYDCWQFCNVPNHNHHKDWYGSLAEELQPSWTELPSSSSMSHHKTTKFKEHQWMVVQGTLNRQPRARGGDEVEPLYRYVCSVENKSVSPRTISTWNSIRFVLSPRSKFYCYTTASVSVSLGHSNSFDWFWHSGYDDSCASTYTIYIIHTATVPWSINRRSRPGHPRCKHCGTMWHTLSRRCGLVCGIMSS